MTKDSIKYLYKHLIIRYTPILFLLLSCFWLQAQELNNRVHESKIQHEVVIDHYINNHYLSNIDSLRQAKAQLLQSRINDLQAKATGKLQGMDSLSNTKGVNFLDEKLNDLAPDQYTAQLTEINQTLEAYQSEITDTEELQWIEHYSGQLDQLEGVVEQYQDKLLNLEELQALKGYQQQLEQLSGEAGGYFQELQNITATGLTDESPLMQHLKSKIGHYPEFQELQKVTAELEQLKNMPQDQQEKLKAYQDPDKLKSQAKELVNKHFSKHQDKLQAAQQKLTTFKKKYSSIQTTKDMSTAVKRNSLEGKPLGERLIFRWNHADKQRSNIGGSVSTIRLSA